MEIINSLIEEKLFQEIIKSEQFYYEELSKVYLEYKNYNIDLFKKDLEGFVSNQPDPFKFQDLLDENIGTPYYDFLMLIGKLIAMCDEKGYNKIKWNTYEDKRVVSRAQFTQKDWTFCYFKYKLNDFTFDGLEAITYSTFRYVVAFLESPKSSVNVTSQGHRKQIVEYFNLNNEEEIISLFADYTKDVKNEKNKGVVVTSIIYQPAIKKLWLDSVIGLMASDGTGWQDEHIDELPGYDASVVWNSKRPSGTTQTLKILRNIVDEGGTFPLYYSSGGNVNYRATIIDFAESQEELDRKQWDKKYDILHYQDKFANYTGASKSANIVFLSKTIEKINPVPVAAFGFYKQYDSPRQDNISPIKSEPQNITKISTSMPNKYSIAEFEKMFKEYLLKVIPKSTSNYLSAAPTLNRIGLRLELIKESFYEIQDPQSYNQFYNVLEKDAEYLEKNKTGHYMYSASLSKYKSFIEELTGKEVANNDSNNVNISLNQILFGPPGTGKTYNSINKAIEIINPKFDLMQERKLVKDEFDRLIRNGQIVFTTFHQSMSYEDFIEGIKPLEPKQEGHPVVYKVVNGILKEFCSQIKNSEKLTTDSNATTAITNFEELYAAFLKRLTEVISNLEEGECYIFPSRKSNVKLLKIEEEGISTSGESTDAVETITKEKLKRIYDKFQSPDDIKNINAQLRIEIGTDISWTTNYYAVFKAIKDFEKSIASSAVEQKAIEPKKYVLIIDEINRGNVSQIFGELITLIEDDKRIGKPEALEATLAYSKERFAIPPNLYLIGTMNTADRSVEALDTALRRRFTFEEIPPNYELEELDYEFAEANVSEILRTINKRIEKLLDKDHLIGHSYFILKDEEDAEEKLINSFYKSIIPLLQEYFFGDFGKIGLVLGNGFVELKNWDDKIDSFADFQHESSSDLSGKEVYKIVDYRDRNLNYSIDINKNKIKMDFEKAVKLLMKKEIA
jgi:5-methylcytosine-specific restriction endonuclease McrBC GTP-binding regulatory subunit McrB